MSRNSVEWPKKPEFPRPTTSTRRSIRTRRCSRKSRKRSSASRWIIACHESELPNAFDYRTFQHPSGKPLVVVRGEDSTVRSFFNICPHRGNTLLYDPVGNTKRITCIFHAWSFDAKGACIDISRAKQGYQDRFTARTAGLREVKTSSRLRRIRLGQHRRRRHARCRSTSVTRWACSMSNMNMPLEVFHYHKAVVDTNYKLWHDTNSEFYHDYMHYFNRVTGMLQPGYFDRKYTGYPQRPRVGGLDDDQVRRLCGRASSAGSAGQASRRAAGS